VFGGFSERMKRLSLWDVKLLQLAAISVGLIIVKLLEPVLNVYSIHIWWFILIAVVCGIKPVLVVLGRQ